MGLRPTRATSARSDPARRPLCVRAEGREGRQTISAHGSAAIVQLVSDPGTDVLLKGLRLGWSRPCSGLAAAKAKERKSCDDEMKSTMLCLRAFAHHGASRREQAERRGCVSDFAATRNIICYDHDTTRPRSSLYRQHRYQATHHLCRSVFAPVEFQADNCTLHRCTVHAWPATSLGR